MFPDSDPLAPLSSRFPLSSAGGRIPISDAEPSGARPFGMRFAVDVQPRECAKHEKRETRRIDKEFDARVTVVGDRVLVSLSTRLTSQHGSTGEPTTMLSATEWWRFPTMSKRE